MLLGFISLLLTVFQGSIQRICIPKGWTNHMLPCEEEDKKVDAENSGTKHFVVGVLGGARRLLAAGGEGASHCSKKGKVPLLSLEALHQLHIFIFVLAITHVVLSVLTMILGGAKIRQWKPWENSLQKNYMGSVPGKVTHVEQFEFIQNRFHGTGNDSHILSWIRCFGKQFYGSVTKSDYTTMRLGFIMAHCKGNPKFDFHKCMVRALEADFKKVVGISWYLWVFVIVFLLLNVNGWHTYFWIAFAPLILLLALGTKLEHVITQLAHDVAEKHSAIEGDLVIKPSDEHFWFGRPRIVLHLIHFILFQNAFEIAFFFWIWTTYGFDSCIMGKVGLVISRLITGATIQILCSYSTLPLYAIVTQMGSSFKKEIFDEDVRESLVGWAQKAKKHKGFRAGNEGSTVSSGVDEKECPHVEIQMQTRLDRPKDSVLEEGSVGPSELNGYQGLLHGQKSRSYILSDKA